MKYLLLIAMIILCSCDTVELAREENTVYRKWCTGAHTIYEATFDDIYTDENGLHIYTQVDRLQDEKIVFEPVITVSDTFKTYVDAVFMQINGKFYLLSDCD